MPEEKDNLSCPLVTIGIACYQSGDTVVRAIQSAMAQTWPNTEILIVEDGSGDDTRGVIKNFIEDFPHIRLIEHETNKGFASALNTIIEHANGDFLAIFDDDDVSHPQRVEKQVARIQEYESRHGVRDIVCHAARIQKYPDGRERYEPTMGTNVDGAAPKGFDVVDRILMGRLSANIAGSCANCSRMARIEIFRNLSGYDTNLRRAEDTDFNVRFAMRGGVFVGIAEALVTQTMTMGVEKKLSNEKQAESILLEKHAPYLKQKGWYAFCKLWLEARYSYFENRYFDFAVTILGIGVRYPIKFLSKLLWILPATDTRKSYKEWHLKEEPLIGNLECNSENTPMITIGICCYNSQDTVERAIKSALLQDWKNFEVIVVDDGSTDNTASVIQKTIHGYANARFIQHEKNRRFPGALNTVISQANGEFIAIFDDDDESHSSRIRIQCQKIMAFEKSKGTRLVACWASGVRRYSNGYEVPLPAIGSRLTPPYGDMVVDFLLCFIRKKGFFYGSGTPSCALMTRKATYHIAGLYDETMIRSEDVDFAIRLAQKGGYFIGCPENILTQFSTGGVEKSPQNTFDSYMVLLNKHKNYLQERGLYDYAFMWLQLRLHYFGKNYASAVSTYMRIFCKYPNRAMEHILTSAPKRLIHEWKMKRNRYL